MSRDVVIHWEAGRKPNRGEIRRVCEDFFGGTLDDLRWSQDRFYIQLWGEASDPLRRIKDARPRPPYEPRDIEVWPSPDSMCDSDCLYVMTRRADPLTNALADELARIFVRHWGGRIFE